MASPLILKIQAELERRGFDDVKRQIDRLRAAIGGLGDEFQETERKSGGFLRGVVAGVITGTIALTAAGIAQERTTARLANTLSGLEGDFESTADAIQILTNEMAKNSLFSGGELRDSLAILTRATGSLTLAEQDAIIAQELALRNNVSLEQATRALALARIGNGRALSELIVEEQNEIETLQELGTLTEAIRGQIEIGEATGRELATISGALQRFSNQATAGFFALGQVVEETVSPATQGLIGLIEGATGGLTDFFNATIFSERRAAEQAVVLGVRFEEINRALTIVGETGVGSFTNRQQAISSIDVALEFFNRDVEELNGTELELVSSLESERVKLVELQKTRRLVAQQSLRDQIQTFRELNLSREDFQRQELQNQLRIFEELRDADVLRGEEAILNQQLITNARLQLSQFEKETVINNIEEEVDARRTLLALLQAPAEALDETASIEERGRALDRLVASRKENLAVIESDRLASIAALDLQADIEQLSEREIENRRKIIEATALARRLETERVAEAGAAEIGDLAGRASIIERSAERINTIERERTRLRREANRELRDQVTDTKRLEGLEDNIKTLREKGVESGDPLLERLINRAETLRESLGDRILPTSEEEAENVATEIERKLDLPAISINFNLDRSELIEAIRAELIAELDAQGFDTSRETAAPTEPDAAPSAPSTPGGRRGTGGFFTRPVRARL